MKVACYREARGEGRRARHLVGVGGFLSPLLPLTKASLGLKNSSSSDVFYFNWYYQSHLIDLKIMVVVTHRSVVLMLLIISTAPALLFLSCSLSLSLASTLLSRESSYLGHGRASLSPSLSALRYHGTTAAPYRYYRCLCTATDHLPIRDVVCTTSQTHRRYTDVALELPVLLLRAVSTRRIRAVGYYLAFPLLATVSQALRHRLVYDTLHEYGRSTTRYTSTVVLVLMQYDDCWS